MFLIAAVLALVVGVSLGLLGGGGSILTVPILRYVLGIEGHAAIALSLLVVGTTSLFGLIAHARRGRVQWRTGLVFGAAGMAGAFGAGRVAHLVPAAVLLIGFGLMMFGTAFAMLRPKRPGADSAGPSGPLPLGKVLAEGLLVGAATGFVGAGGGFLVVPALVLLGNLPMDVAVGTSLLVIALKSLAGFAGFLGHVPVDWTLAAVLGSSAIAGSVVGSALASHVSPAALRRAFGWFVIAMAFFILSQELPPLLGQPASLPLAVGVSAVATTLVFLVRRRRAARPGRAPRERSRSGSLPAVPRSSSLRISQGS